MTTRTVEVRQYTKKPLALVNVLFTCPTLGKNVTVRADDLEWDYDSAD